MDPLCDLSYLCIPLGLDPDDRDCPLQYQRSGIVVTHPCNLNPRYPGNRQPAKEPQEQPPEGRQKGRLQKQLQESTQKDQYREPT
jgi:hypothetical protein